MINKYYFLIDMIKLIININIMQTGDENNLYEIIF